MVGPLNDVYRDYAGDINDSGKMLLSLVNDILDLAKVEAGHFELHEETVDVGDTMRSVGAILALRAGQAGVAVAFAPPPDPVRARADARALRQVMLNLLSNAIKFTPSGGRVTLTLDRCPKGGVRIAVADTGIGIAAADIARALEPFGQVRNDAIKVQEGTGLGLPISKALIELHGGTFGLASKPGSGTTLTVTLPPERSLA
jgi:signal transduction histidine kinase